MLTPEEVIRTAIREHPSAADEKLVLETALDAVTRTAAEVSQDVFRSRSCLHAMLALQVARIFPQYRIAAPSMPLPLHAAGYGIPARSVSSSWRQ